MPPVARDRSPPEIAVSGQEIVVLTRIQAQFDSMNKQKGRRKSLRMRPVSFFVEFQ